MTAPRSIVVLGGGVAGLAAGYYLSQDGHAVTVVERAPGTGGLCASFESHGFTLDLGPHKLYSVVPGILDEIRSIMGPDLIEHKKRNRIRLLGNYLAYPLSMSNLLPLLGPARSVKMGMQYASALARSWVTTAAPASYEEYVVRRFGRGVYELVFEPLAWKVWGDPTRLSAELAAARIPSGGAAELILRLLKLKPSTPDVDAPFFYYPRGGFGAFPTRLADKIRARGGRVLTRATVSSLRRKGAAIEAVEVVHEGGSEQLPCDMLVSSIPIQSLARLLCPEDKGLEAVAQRLEFRQLILVYLILKEDRVLEDHWIFFPEKQFPFNRLFEQKAMQPELGPPGRTALCCDVTCDLDDETWTASDDELGRRCFEAVVAAGLTHKDRLETVVVKRFRDFYPVYSRDYRERVRAAYEPLRSAENLLLTGRLGMFNYNNSDHCLDMGRFIAQGLRAELSAGEIWTRLEERVRGYRIVD